MIKHVSWYQDLTEEEAIRHTMSNPSMADIMRLFYRLDAEEFSSFTLSLDETGERFPKLSVYGGTSGYAISLSEANQDGNSASTLLTYVNPDAQDPSASCYRVVGRTYPGCEIEERFFTADANLIRTIIEYFANTGHWRPGISFTVERDDDDGLHREYTQLLGESYEYPDP